MSSPSLPTLGSRIGLGWLVLSALAVTAFSAFPYATAGLGALAEAGTGLASNYSGRPVGLQFVLYLHIVGGSLALVLGGVQFPTRLRRRLPRLHRVTGRIVLVAILLAAAAGLVLAPVNAAGPVGVAGFGALAVLWPVTAARGYRAIRRGDVAAHRAWMMRAFSLSYAAVTLRLWLIGLTAGLTAGGVPADAAFAQAYAAVPFLCWLPNLLVAEWLIRRRGLPSYRLPASAPTTAA